MAVLYIRDKTTLEFIPINTIQGSSAYQIAVKNGFIGTEKEWLASLKGDPGTLGNLTKADVENVLTGDITSHNHDTEYLGKTAKASSATTSDSCTGNASTATKLATARTISISGGVTGTATSFDGSANISIPVTSVDATKLSGTAAVNTSGSSGSCSGNSATATKLANARTISISGGVTGTATSFDGSANISIPVTSVDATKLSGTAAVNTSGSSGSCSGNSATATKLANARTVTIGAKSNIFDGSGNISYALADIGAAPTSHTHTKSQITDFPTSMPASDVSAWAKAASKPNYSYSEITGTPADRSGVNTVNSLASLPVDKDVIYATLSAATDISLASALSLGQSITIVCLPSAGFTQPIPTSNGFTSMDGDSLTFVSGKLAEISILCYATNNYSISSKIAS